MRDDAGTDQTLEQRYPTPFLTILFALRRKRSVPQDLFYDYWRDAHCQISSRLPGQYHLWTHRLDYDGGQAWPRVPDIERHLPEAERFDGVPEPVFLTEADLQGFLPRMGPLMDDEHNIFEETIGYRALGDNSRVFLDRLPDPAPVFDEGALRMLVFCQQSSSVSTETFRSFMFERLAPTWAQAEEVLKLRMHLFEPHVNEDVLIGGDHLSHYKAPESQYQAAFEIVFADALAMRRFAASQQWLADEQARHMRAQHAFRVVRRYALRYKGEMTLCGLRTPGVAEQIHRVGALNQLRPDVVELLGGR